MERLPEKQRDQLISKIQRAFQDVLDQDKVTNEQI